MIGQAPDARRGRGQRLIGPVRVAGWSRSCGRIGTEGGLGCQVGPVQDHRGCRGAGAVQTVLIGLVTIGHLLYSAQKPCDQWASVAPYRDSIHTQKLEAGPGKAPAISDS